MCAFLCIALTVLAKNSGVLPSKTTNGVAELRHVVDSNVEKRKRDERHISLNT